MRISSGVHSPHSRHQHRSCRIESEEQLFFGRGRHRIFECCTMLFDKTFGLPRLPLQLQPVPGVELLHCGSPHLGDGVA